MTNIETLNRWLGIFEWCHVEMAMLKTDASDALRKSIEQGEKEIRQAIEKNGAPPPRQPEHGDSARLDWLTNNPLEALDIFGHVKGADAVRWIRQDIDNRIKESA